MNNTARRRDDPGKEAKRDFHGAAVITSDGREVPITEEMVRQALRVLEQTCQSGARARSTPSCSAPRAL